MDKIASRLEDIVFRLNAKKNRLLAYENLSDWGLIRGEGEKWKTPPSAKDARETASIRISWASGQEDVWFVKDVVLPDSVEGLGTVGARAELLLMMTIGAEVYVDRALRIKEPYWASSVHLPVLLSEKLSPGSRFELAIHTFKGDGFGVFAQSRVRITAVDEAAMELEKWCQELVFFSRLIAWNRVPRRAESSFSRALETIDLQGLERNDWAVFRGSMEKARGELMPFQAESKKFVSYVVGHAHIDMNWLWTWDETVETCRRDFSTVDTIMGENPDFHFSQSQVAVYQATQASDAPLFSRVRERVKGGRWEMTAATWVEGDLNMASEESLVRQILYSGYYTQKELGVVPDICWEPDTFGHPATLPQVLAKSGIKYYYCTRGGKGDPLFWWKAPDGSKVMVFCDPYFYNGEINSSEIVNGNIDLFERYGLTGNLFVYGVGNHGGGPTRHDLGSVVRLNDDSLLPEVRCAKAADFFASADGAKLPVIQDELNPYWTGCLTTHGDVKRMHRLNEISVIEAEFACTLAALLGHAYPAPALQAAWRDICFNQFHDIVCGCAIHSTYERSQAELSRVLEKTKAIKDSAFDFVASRIKVAGRSIAVFNSLSWERVDPVELDPAPLGMAPDKSYVATGPDGERRAVQIAQGSAVFMARVPACGYSVYRIEEGEAAGDSHLSASEKDLVLENELVLVQIHSDSGAVVRLYDKVAHRELAPLLPDQKSHREFKEILGDINVLQVLTEQPHTMAAWNIGSIMEVRNLVKGCTARLVESGPVRAVIRTTRTYKSSAITQDIILHAGGRRIDFKTVVDWQDPGNAIEGMPMLRASFAPKLAGTRATFEIPFGSIVRNADGQEMPALRWVDISEEDYGVSILNNCKYGHSVEGNTIRLTLLRCSYEPDTRSDIGGHEFTYSLYPHQGDAHRALVFRKARELNHPLHPLAAHGTAEVLPASLSMLRLEPENMMLTTAKATEAGWEKLSQRTDAARFEMTLRAFETAGRMTTCTIQLPWKTIEAWEVDMRENEQRKLTVGKSGIVRFTAAPYEIKTLKLLVERGSL